MGIAPMVDLEALSDATLTDIAIAPSLEALDALRVALLGKSGAVTAALKALGSLPPDEKKARGAEVNRAKEHINDAIAARMHEVDGHAGALEWAAGFGLFD